MESNVNIFDILIILSIILSKIFRLEVKSVYFFQNFSSTKQLAVISLATSSPGYQLQTKIGFNNKIVKQSDVQTYLKDFQNQANAQILSVLPSGYNNFTVDISNTFGKLKTKTNFLKA